MQVKPERRGRHVGSANSGTPDWFISRTTSRRSANIRFRAGKSSAESDRLLLSFLLERSAT